MQPNKHTPGPWCVEHDGHHPPGKRAKRPPYPTMVMVVAEKGGMPGVLVSQGVVEPRDFANAHLIAAAPDMYELLIRMRPHLHAQWGAEIDRVLAKAEGK